MTEILVPLDGSSLATRALPLAITLAKARGEDLTLVEAIELPVAGIAVPVVELEAAAKSYLETEAQGILLQHGLSPRTFAEFGFPVGTILRRASSPAVSSIVMTTHGRTGLLRAVIGSVAEQVVREASVPVFLVPASAPAQPRPELRRILVPLDGSDVSYSVMSPVVKLAQEFNSEIVLMRVYDEPRGVVRYAPDVILTEDQQLERSTADAERFFAPIRGRLRDMGLSVSSELALGDPGTEIVSVANRIEPSLVALATHARSGLNRVQHGSVAEMVLRHSRVPVMTFGREALKRLAKDVGEQAAGRPTREEVLTSAPAKK